MSGGLHVDSTLPKAVRQSCDGTVYRKTETWVQKEKVHVCYNEVSYKLIKNESYTMFFIAAIELDTHFAGITGLSCIK